MALKIRLRQQGCSNRQTFRVVVTDIRSKRDGKYIEKLGWYLPEQADNNCSIDGDRLAYWLSQGALMTEQVERLAKVVAPTVLQDYKIKKAELRVRRTAKRRTGSKESLNVSASGTKSAKKVSKKV